MNENVDKILEQYSAANNNTYAYIDHNKYALSWRKNQIDYTVLLRFARGDVDITGKAIHSGMRTVNDKVKVFESSAEVQYHVPEEAMLDTLILARTKLENATLEERVIAEQG